MNNTIKYTLIALVIIGVIAGLIYKASAPNDYQHPRYRSM
jgi:hypothetical protein